MSIYRERVKSRSSLKFYLGVITRTKLYILYSFNRWLAKKNGAFIGENTVIPYKLAKNANSNLSIGNNCSIQTGNIDLRAKVTIGDHVIIGENVEIIVASHNVDSTEWELKLYGITIDDYVWVATNCLVLPSCKHIKYGAVCGGGSVVARNVEEMSIIAGNPAVEIRKRKTVHKDLVVSSLLGGDLKIYIKTYRNIEKKD